MNLNNKTFKIFVDFDGTIAQKDIGEEMFLRFGDVDKVNEIAQQWINSKIKATDTWTATCGTVEGFNHDEFDNFLGSIQIDPGFKKFVEWCSDKKHELRILSDGFDYYINKFMKREELHNVEVHTNKLAFGDKNKLQPSFPYTDEECTKCANCKRNHILNFTSEDDYTVYVGDGFTDFCPSQFCDFIFAKNSLLKYCEVNRITYFPYTTFNDVIKKLDELSEKKRLRKRHQAELKRREVFIQG
jgi:2-hydroxy-3-keto-5-methylthiopentenyl-1-phosphate phosphatase